MLHALGDKTTDDDLQAVIDFEEEQHRLGNFEKIFPCINNVKFYGQFFEHQRNLNRVLEKYLDAISPKHNEHHVSYIPPSEDPILKEKKGR